MRMILPGLMLVLAAAAPADMSVQTFIAKADALQAQGILAATSPDLAALRAEIMKASGAYRAGLDAEAKAGRSPSSCPPPKGQAHLSSDELVAAFKALPPPQRTASVTSAFAAYMIKRFPCHR